MLAAAAALEAPEFAAERGEVGGCRTTVLEHEYQRTAAHLGIAVDAHAGEVVHRGSLRQTEADAIDALAGVGAQHVGQLLGGRSHSQRVDAAGRIFGRVVRH